VLPRSVSLMDNWEKWCRDNIFFSWGDDWWCMVLWCWRTRKKHLAKGGDSSSSQSLLTLDAISGNNCVWVPFDYRHYARLSWKVLSFQIHWIVTDSVLLCFGLWSVLSAWYSFDPILLWNRPWSTNVVIIAVSKGLSFYSCRQNTLPWSEFPRGW